MKRLNKTGSFILLLSFLCLSVYSQTVKISGKVVDEIKGETLVGANVVVKGSTTGTATNIDGVFELEIGDTNQVTLVFTYVGYQQREVVLVKPFKFTEIRLKDFVIAGEQIVITASRVSESIMESPITVDKMDAREIRTAPSGDFYKGLGNFADVDVVSSSIAFNVINLRGFNTSQPERSVQYIDGIDNQAPGLNFAVGNLMGANDLELQSVEVIHGPASALYGANAFQGVVDMTTKDPYLFPGLSVQLKGGSRSYVDVQGRYARTFGKNDQFAFKLAGSFMRIDDWEADDDSANTYGDLDVDVNLSEIIQGQRYKPVCSYCGINKKDSLTLEESNDAVAITDWLGFNPEASPGVQNIKAPGYLEARVADYNTKAWKISPSFHWKYKKDNEVSYMFKYGSGTAVYQGTNRYSIKDITFQQHKLEFSGKNYFARVYTTMENAGDSYDNVFTAINISKYGITEYVSAYLGQYFDTLKILTTTNKDTAGFCAECLRREWVELARQSALRAADTLWPIAGTPLFDSLFNAITTDPNLKTGSKFLDESKMVVVEGQYRFNDYVKWLDLIAGVSYRAFLPSSQGTIFSDTLKNAADTLPDGRNNPDAEYVKIRTHEFGIYAQATKKLFKDKLKLIASFRFDKHQNFKPQYSPRGSIVFTQGNHVLRLSAQSAFRTPTLQDQFILLDLGPITLVGNVGGFEKPVYTLNSIDSFRAVSDSALEFQEEFYDLLKVVTIKPLRPEQVRTLEFGYRMIHNKVLYLDFTVYYNWYKNFIGDIRVAIPKAGEAGQDDGNASVQDKTEGYDLVQVPINSTETVRTYGFSVGMSYYFGKGITLKGNYTYSGINEDDLKEDDIIPGFNTPNHKFNIGLEGKRIWEGLGFNTNFKWADGYLWQAPFGDGDIPPYYILDAQINYEIKKIYTTLGVGSSNLTGNKYRTAYGSPLVGRLLYAFLTFDINKW